LETNPRNKVLSHWELNPGPTKSGLGLQPRSKKTIFLKDGYDWEWKPGQACLTIWEDIAVIQLATKFGDRFVVAVPKNNFRTDVNYTAQSDLIAQPV
jgi:hypothetical protein